MEDSEPVQLRHLRDILGAYARQVLGWYSLDDVADDDIDGVGGMSKTISTPLGLPTGELPSAAPVTV